MDYKQQLKRDIIYRYGTIKAFCKQYGIGYQALVNFLSGVSMFSADVPKALDALGYELWYRPKQQTVVVATELEVADEVLNG